MSEGNKKEWSLTALSSFPSGKGVCPTCPSSSTTEQMLEATKVEAEGAAGCPEPLLRRLFQIYSPGLSYAMRTEARSLLSLKLAFPLGRHTVSQKQEWKPHYIRYCVRGLQPSGQGARAVAVQAAVGIAAG
ncbi:hypothetical protein QTO34_009524 [Cnephaeus nilssonii]|uniref:Uncharacterized protein n=1 Tax=Cnephaeus nilssonii TaxID=3371016 RepID=A0AA40HHZ4_CNENI|nr:hypothetical protein QTO34_009524 [Eptesicus nilssonii]